MAAISETIKRLSIALLVVPVVLGALFFSKTGFSVLVAVASVLMALELLSIADVKSIRTYKFISISSVLIIVLLFVLTTFPDIKLPGKTKMLDLNPVFLVFFLSTIAVFTFETFQKEFTRSLETVSVHVLTLIYCAVSMGFLLKLTNLNPYYMLYIWLVTWMTDTGAYFSGKYLGKHKLNLKSSPNKTLEGFIGGVLISLLSAVILKLIFPDKFPNDILVFKWPVFIIMSLLFAIVTIFGDLAESIMKRSSGIKDSKTYIPGHGGMLDVMDSMVYTVPLFYFLIRYLD